MTPSLADLIIDWARAKGWRANKSYAISPYRYYDRLLINHACIGYVEGQWLYPTDRMKGWNRIHAADPEFFEKLTNMLKFSGVVS